jgi:hypothetical protein
MAFMVHPEFLRDVSFRSRGTRQWSNELYLYEIRARAIRAGVSKLVVFVLLHQTRPKAHLLIPIFEETVYMELGCEAPAPTTLASVDKGW